MLREDEIIPLEDRTVPIEEPPAEPYEPPEEPLAEPEEPVQDIVPSEEPTTPVEIQATPLEDQTAPVDEPAEPAEPVPEDFPPEVQTIPFEDRTSPIEEPPPEPPQEVVPFDEPTTPVEMRPEDQTTPIEEPPAEPSVQVGMQDILSEDRPALDEEPLEPSQPLASFDEPPTPVELVAIPSEDQAPPEEISPPPADQLTPQAVLFGDDDVLAAADVTSPEEQFLPQEPVTIKPEEFVPSEEEEKEEPSAMAESQDDEEWIVVDSTAPAEQEVEEKQPTDQLLQLGDEGEFGGEGVGDEKEEEQQVEEEIEGGKGERVEGEGEEQVADEPERKEEELEQEREGDGEVKDEGDGLIIPEYQPQDIIEFEEVISLEKEVIPEPQATLGDGEDRSESLVEPLSPYYERPVPSEKPRSPPAFMSSSPVENDFDGEAEPPPSQTEELSKEPEDIQPQDEGLDLGERDEGDQIQSPLGSSFLPVSVQEASADEKSETSSTAAVPTTPPLSMVVERGSPVPELTEASVTSQEDDEQEDPDVRDVEAPDEGQATQEGGADDVLEMPSSPMQEELQTTEEGVAREAEEVEIGDATEDGEDEAQDGGGEGELGEEREGDGEGEGEEGGGEEGGEREEPAADLLGDDTLATPIQLEPDPPAQGIVDDLLDFEPQASTAPPPQPDPFGMDPLELVTTPPHHQQQSDIFGQDPFGAAAVDPPPVEQHYNPFAPGPSMDPFSMGGQDFGGPVGGLNQPAQGLLDPLGDEGGWAGGLRPEQQEGDDLRDSGVQSPDILQPEGEGGGSSREPEFGEGGGSFGGPDFGEGPSGLAQDRFGLGGMGERTEEGDAFGQGSSADPAPADEDLGSPID